MTAVESDAAHIFADARFMRDAALERMAAGDIRDAAEKAWCATMRAAEALVLARTGEEPRTSTVANRRLRAIAAEDGSVRNLAHLYSYRQDVLHGECFYHEYCQPEVTEQLINETLDYIQDAERLASPSS